MVIDRQTKSAAFETISLPLVRKVSGRGSLGHVAVPRVSATESFAGHPGGRSDSFLGCSIG
jgi:hypothetical protein